MKKMFEYAGSFNQDLSSWNVSKVGYCEKFRKGATNYILPIPNFTLCNPN